MYLLLTLSILLFDKICLITQVLRDLYILLETGRKLGVPKSYKGLFQVLSRGGLQNNILGKSRDYNTTISRQEKRQQPKN